MLTCREFLSYPFTSAFTRVEQDKLDALLVFVDRNYCLSPLWQSVPANRKDALALLAAHMGYLQWLADADLAQKAIALREASGSGSSPQSLEDWYKLSTYGVQFLDISNRIGAIAAANSSTNGSSSGSKPNMKTGFAF
jgi:hypothetical protein